MTGFEKSWSIYTGKGLAQKQPEPNLFLYKYSNFSQIQSYFIPIRQWRRNRQSVLKRWHIKFRRQGITQKKAYNIQNRMKVWNQEYSMHFSSPHICHTPCPTNLLKWITPIISGAVSYWLESFLYMHVNTELIKFCEKSSWEHVDIIMTEHVRASSWYNLLQPHHLVSLVHPLKNDRCNDNNGDDDNDDNFVVFYLNFHPVS